MTTVVEFPDQGALAEEAAAWLIRLDADTPPTREDLQALGEWLHRSPAHREELERLAVLWGRMNVLTELAVPLGNSKPAARAQRRGAIAPRRSMRRVGLLAASVAIVLVFAFMLARGPALDPFLSTNGLYATAVGQQVTTKLADGSEVMLNTNSQIKVDYGRGYREVHLLQGEALFTVAKDAKRPFRVYAGNGRIEALGTAFSVFLNGTHIDVAVTEGRVSLASMKSSRSNAQSPSASARPSPDATGSGPGADDDFVESLGTLKAGQVATIGSPAAETAGGGVSALQSIEPIAPEELAQRLAWRDGVLMFSGDTLGDAVKELSRYTTVTIEIPDPAVRSMRIGGRFPVGETEAMLAALETNFNLRVTRLGRDRVVLSAHE